MPNLSALTKQQRICQAAQVLILIAQDNMTVDEACTHVGINRQIYYHWLKEGQDAISEFFTLRDGYQRMTYAGILVAQYNAVLEMLREVREPTTKPTDRVTVMKYLDEVRKEIEEDFRAQGALDDTAANYLQGPQVTKAQSRLRANTVNVAPLPDGSIDITTYTEPDIVDSHIISRENPEDLE